MSNWDKLKDVDVKNKQDIERHTKLDKRVNDIKKVISNPDKWNVNLASRDRLDELEARIKKLEEFIHEITDRNNKRIS
jgi:hypothetical protein